MNEEAEKLKEGRDSREFPCLSCSEGEYEHISTIPHGMGVVEVYRCNHCGDEKTWP